MFEDFFEMSVEEFKIYVENYQKKRITNSMELILAAPKSLELCKTEEQINLHLASCKALLDITPKPKNPSNN